MTRAVKKRAWLLVNDRGILNLSILKIIFWFKRLWYVSEIFYFSCEHFFKACNRKCTYSRINIQRNRLWLYTTYLTTRYKSSILGIQWNVRGTQSFPTIHNVLVHANTKKMLSNCPVHFHSVQRLANKPLCVKCYSAFSPSLSSSRVDHNYLFFQFWFSFRFANGFCFWIHFVWKCKSQPSTNIQNIYTLSIHFKQKASRHVVALCDGCRRC